MRARSHHSMLGLTWSPTNAGLTILLTLPFLMYIFFLTSAAQPAQGQTYRVLYNFTDSGPAAGLTMDRAGNLYGTTPYGGSAGVGSVFELERTSPGWRFRTLHEFAGLPDGAAPFARVIFGPDGALYGTTVEGGIFAPVYCNGGCGIVFRLTQPARTCTSDSCPWKEAVLYSFTDLPDGTHPYSELVFDPAGNIYGTTSDGGGGPEDGIFGTVFQLSPANGSWTKNIIWRFNFFQPDGISPIAGVILDRDGKLYGTAAGGGLRCGRNNNYSCGTVYQLTPTSDGWTLDLLYSFHNGLDGGVPVASLVRDELGNLYGTTQGADTGSHGVYGRDGSVFMLSPANDGWTFNVLHTFGAPLRRQFGGHGPRATLTRDSQGNLYGTTAASGANGFGNVFKLTPLGGGWLYTSVYDFTGGEDGGGTSSNVVIDATGRLYGTTGGGGLYGQGVVWQITP